MQEYLFIGKLQRYNKLQLGHGQQKARRLNIMQSSDTNKPGSSISDTNFNT